MIVNLLNLFKRKKNNKLCNHITWFIVSFITCARLSYYDVMNCSAPEDENMFFAKGRDNKLYFIIL